MNLELREETMGKGSAVTTRIVVANAPVSYGAFELTVGRNLDVPEREMVLDEVAAAGYAGIDLGPAGYLGDGHDLAEGLTRRGLSLAGGFLELPFSDSEALRDALGQVNTLLDAFDFVTLPPSGFKPRPTLADAGSDLRRARPFQAARDRSLGLSSDGWQRFASGVERAVERCRARGYEPTFHHEPGTYIEAVWEIEKLLELTTIGLCLDTGHLMLGQGDPVRAMSDWLGRINHIHLKDVHMAAVEDMVRKAAPVQELWHRPAFCRLGDGDLNLDRVLDGLRATYNGWLVVEQDVWPGPGQFSKAAADQRANREYLASRGF